MIDNTDYIILFQSGSRKEQHIFIIDINTWNIYEFVVKSQERTVGWSIINVFGIEDNDNKQSIVQGYILVNYGVNGYVEFPMDLVSLLIIYYNRVYVYFASDNSDLHCKIASDRLLCDMSYVGVFWSEMKEFKE